MNNRQIITHVLTLAVSFGLVAAGVILTEATLFEFAVSMFASVLFVSVIILFWMCIGAAVALYQRRKRYEELDNE